MNKSINIRDAILLTGAEKQDFSGEFVADCCGSNINKGNAFYSIPTGGECDEVDYECCSKCLKKRAYFEKHRYDNFDAKSYLAT